MVSWSNAEMTSLSQGVYTARGIAMNRMEMEALRLTAKGVVEVVFESYTEILEGDSEQNRPGGFIMHCTAYGTAIGPDPGGPVRRDTISLRVSLGDNAPPVG